jgi:hypothetical protein
MVAPLRFAVARLHASMIYKLGAGMVFMGHGFWIYVPVLVAPGVDFPQGDSF